MENNVDILVWQLVHLIKRKYLSTSTTYRRFDLAQTIQYFTLDVITSLSMTEPFGFIEHDEDVYEYVEHYRAMLPQMQVMVSIPLLNRLMRVEAFKRISQWALGDKVGIGKTKQYRYSFPLMTNKPANTKSQGGTRDHLQALRRRCRGPQGHDWLLHQEWTELARVRR